MPAPFAALESRVNAVTLAKLANVTATVGAATVSGIFDAAYVSPFDLAAGSRPVLHCATADVAGYGFGTAVVVNGVNYTVAEAQPDGAGMTLLLLEKV